MHCRCVAELWSSERNLSEMRVSNKQQRKDEEIKLLLPSLSSFVDSNKAKLDSRADQSLASCEWRVCSRFGFFFGFLQATFDFRFVAAFAQCKRDANNLRANKLSPNSSVLKRRKLEKRKFAQDLLFALRCFVASCARTSNPNRDSKFAGLACDPNNAS